MFAKTYLAVPATALLLNAANAFTLVEQHKGASFFDGFDFFTAEDPTHGAVRYVDYTESIDKRLIGIVETSNNSKTEQPVYIGVNSKGISNSARESVRINGKKTYNHGLLIADVAAIPSGCGVWPALWMAGDNWPANGEIDIMESVNGAPSNTVTLHTSANCAIANSSSGFDGTVSTADCDVNSPSQSKNAGCGIAAPANETYSMNGQTCVHATAGKAFNTQGGGVYATLWETSGVTVWFFPRAYIPSDIASGTPNPSTWTSKPQAKFSGSGCDFDAHLKDLRIVVNTDFCGDWAGNTWAQNGCAASTGVATCQEYVNNHPEAFEDAYWLINSVSMYQNGTAN